jgi:hypothetical protein
MKANFLGSSVHPFLSSLLCFPATLSKDESMGLMSEAMGVEGRIFET